MHTSFSPQTNAPTIAHQLLPTDKCAYKRTPASPHRQMRQQMHTNFSPPLPARRTRWSCPTRMHTNPPPPPPPPPPPAACPQDPVVLPDSRITLDRATIERHLLSSRTDPFSRAPLEPGQLVPDAALRARIQAWEAERGGSLSPR